MGAPTSQPLMTIRWRALPFGWQARMVKVVSGVLSTTQVSVEATTIVSVTL